MATKLTVRPVTREDAAAILGIYSPFIQNTTVTFEIEVPSVSDFADRISNITASYPWIVCEVDGSVAGYAYAARHGVRAAYMFSADLSVYVSPEFSRRGIGKLLCKEIMSLAKSMGVCHLFSAVTVPNEPSFALHRALGFEQCGYFKRAGRKFGSWRDLAWFEIELSNTPPTALLPVANVLAEHFGKENKKEIVFKT